MQGWGLCLEAPNCSLFLAVHISESQTHQSTILHATCLFLVHVCGVYACLWGAGHMGWIPVYVCAHTCGGQVAIVLLGRSPSQRLRQGLSLECRVYGTG